MHLITMFGRHGGKERKTNIFFRTFQNINEAKRPSIYWSSTEVRFSERIMSCMRVYQGGYYDEVSCYKFWGNIDEILKKYWWNIEEILTKRTFEEILTKRTFEEVSSPSTYFQSYLEERLRDGHFENGFRRKNKLGANSRLTQV